jgi:hypothetical protein
MKICLYATRGRIRTACAVCSGRSHLRIRTPGAAAVLVDEFRSSTAKIVGAMGHPNSALQWRIGRVRMISEVHFHCARQVKADVTA